MKLGGESSSQTSARRSSARAYLLDMIEELAELSRRSDEVELAILLRAILEASRAAESNAAGISSG